ncbi:MAG: 2-dehydro-3-deoxyglucarate aldolase [Proteobacteria bacterium]|nr:MAG: 2-dehydro-3-deoxyglucarate aldolase [Pseudomonadota bacterium]
MADFMDRLAGRQRGLLGTWAKIPSLETIELMGHAGFDFVVIDLEHAPLTVETAYRMIVTAQGMGMAALVRLSDRQGSQVQRLLDSGADGLLVPHSADLSTAERISASMVFAPGGTRGLGATSRAGRWGTLPMEEYLRQGDKQCLRMLQLEDWEVMGKAADYLALPHVGGVFMGLGDLFLSTGRKPSEPETLVMVKSVLEAAKAAGKESGIAASSPEEARLYLDMGYSLVMVSNDTTLFAKAVNGVVAATLEGLG